MERLLVTSSRPRADVSAAATPSPSIAEQYVDRQARLEPMRARQIEFATGRVVLHALDEPDLRRWMFTDLVMVDETIRGGLSHPLTINPRLLPQRQPPIPRRYVGEAWWVTKP
jgi:hypothetical protein